MRWLPFILLAYLMLGLQIGLAGIARFGSGEINFVLIAAAFIAINAQRTAALPACFALGLLHDLVGIGPIGTYALAYSLVALTVAGTDRALSVEHPFTHVVVTFVGGVITGLTVWCVGFGKYGIHTPLGPQLLTAVYTAIVAWPSLWVLTRMRRVFRFKTSVGR
ncbi:MAG: rod shape-determining protein MreD [Tepidisphaeraceae bacterium]